MFTASSWAQSELSVGNTESAPVVIDDEYDPNIAKNKTYLGGVDEEDLRVQKDLKIPYRTISLRYVQKEVYKEVLKEASDVDKEQKASAEIEP